MGPANPGGRGVSSSTGSSCGSCRPTIQLPAHVGRRIDATERVVAPGFIDLHSHGGLMILAEPRHEPKVRQGITTEIVGVDGNGFAPFPRREDLEAFVELDSGLDGRPAIAYDWDSVGRYLERFDGTVSVNIGTLVGNSALRIDALGWDDVPADARAMDRMRGLLRGSMDQGAVGLSSGLDYPPGSFATTEELAELTAEAGRAGGFYHSHVRYQLGDRYLDPFREAIEIGRRAGAPRPHHPLLSPRDASRPGRAAARVGRRRASDRARRHLRYVSLGVGEHPAAHPDAGLDPGGWARSR